MDTKPEDETEELRRKEQQRLNAAKAAREVLEAEYGEVWSTEELTRAFEVQGFMAPYVVVVRREDGKRGSLEFQHDPRFYFNFEPHKER